jgi:aspartyl protease family protein
MVLRGGVYQIPIEVNDIPLYFILDTGASSISISAAEAAVMAKQGTITRQDVLGEKNFQTATGDIVAGTIIILRKVRIGDKVLTNVEASVVDNIEAPLLLGQSALQRFGKISIDNTRHEITFE